MTSPYLYDNLTNKENKYMFAFMYVCVYPNEQLNLSFAPVGHSTLNGHP